MFFFFYKAENVAYLVEGDLNASITVTSTGWDPILKRKKVVSKYDRKKKKNLNYRNSNQKIELFRRMSFEMLCYRHMSEMVLQ